MKNIFIFLFLVSTVVYADCPEDMVRIDNFCIDRYEAPNIRGQIPFVAQTATDGEEWCQRHGKNLCTENQWLRTCRGDENRISPYGNSFIPGKCNNNKKWIRPNWPKVLLFPFKLEGLLEVNRLNQADPSGLNEECKTPEGVYDLGGNTTEWVSKSNINSTRHQHLMMGCYWVGCYNSGTRKKVKGGCLAINPAHSGIRGKFRTYEAGFRCCKDLPTFQ